MRGRERVPPAAPGAAHRGERVSILNPDPRPPPAFRSAAVLEMSPQSSVLRRLEPFQLADDTGQSQMLLQPWGQTQLFRLNLLNCIKKKERKRGKCQKTPHSCDFAQVLSQLNKSPP